MTLGVVFQGGGTPLRIAAAGQDADGADVFDLLFNGDKEPLRLSGTGYVSVPSLRAYDWTPAFAERSSAVINVPEGTYPLVLVAGRPSGYGGTGLLQTVSHTYAGGFGVFVSSSRELWGINFSRDIAEPWMYDAVINYAILKNHG